MKRFTDRDLRSVWRVKRSPKWEKEEEKERPIYTAGLLIGETLIEQRDNKQFIIYDLVEQKFVIPDRAERIWSCYTTEEGLTFRPLPKLPWRPLPVPNLNPANEEELYGEVRRFIYRKVDFASDIQYDVASAWVLHTWRIENFNVTPYLFFFGPPASGMPPNLWEVRGLWFAPNLPVVGISPSKMVRRPIESAEVEVPFDVYEQCCSKCSYLLEMLTPHSQYIEQHSRWVDDREPIKIICSGYARCVHAR